MVLPLLLPGAACEVCPPVDPASMRKGVVVVEEEEGKGGGGLDGRANAVIAMPPSPPLEKNVPSTPASDPFFSLMGKKRVVVVEGPTGIGKACEGTRLTSFSRIFFFFCPSSLSSSSASANGQAVAAKEMGEMRWDDPSPAAADPSNDTGRRGIPPPTGTPLRLVRLLVVVPGRNLDPSPSSSAVAAAAAAGPLSIEEDLSGSTEGVPSEKGGSTSGMAVGMGCVEGEGAEGARGGPPAWAFGGHSLAPAVWSSGRVGRRSIGGVWPVNGA